MENSWDLRRQDSAAGRALFRPLFMRASLGLGLFAQTLFAGACGSKQFAMGQGSDCEAGRLGCVCKAQGQCGAGLECQRDRCVESSEKSTSTKKEETSSDKDQNTSQSSSSSDSSSSSEEPSSCVDDKDCEALSGPCTQGQCKAKTCVTINVADKSPCEDQNACIPEGSCNAGVCEGKSTRFFETSFAQGMQDWQTDSKSGGPSIWKVAKAQASSCDASDKGEDPAEDHSDSSDNMLAGTKIGGCAGGQVAFDWDCLLSPDIRVSRFDGTFELSYWRHLHSPPTRIGKRQGAEHRIYAVLDGESPMVLEEGYQDGVNDAKWVRKSHTFKAKARSLYIAFCVRAGFSASAFAGWSVDDIRLRAQGCDPGR